MDSSCGVSLSLSLANRETPSYQDPLRYLSRCLSLSQDALEGHRLGFFDVPESLMVCAQNQPSRTKHDLCAGAIWYIVKLWPSLLFSLSFIILIILLSSLSHSAQTLRHQENSATCLIPLAIIPLSIYSYPLLAPKADIEQDSPWLGSGTFHDLQDNSTFKQETLVKESGWVGRDREVQE